MVKMRSKKGAAGHVEMIISFLIFITFVVFLLIFVNPIEKNKDTEHYLDMTEKAVTDYLETNLTLFSISFDSGIISAGSCYCMDYDYPSEVIAKDETNNGISAITSFNYICLQPTLDGLSVKKFYRFYFSEEFTENPGVCTGPPVDSIIDSKNFTLGVINEYKKVSNQSLYNLNQDYNTDYEDLRTNTLKLDNHFNIEVRTTEGELLAYGKIKEPKETDIIAKDIPIEIINEDGEIIPAIMNIQTWE